MDTTIYSDEMVSKGHNPGSIRVESGSEGIFQGRRIPEMDWQLCRAIAISELVCCRPSQLSDIYLR